jgi:hypothetical protein
MAMQFTYLPDFPRRSIHEADIAECEAYLGVALPPDLRAFLLAHDGPVPNPAWIPIQVAGDTKWLGPIYSLTSVMGPLEGNARAYAIEMRTAYHREEHKLPRHFVVFCNLLTQPSTLLLSVAAADHGAVYAWHEGMKRFKPEQLVRVAGSFAEFLALLAEPPADVSANFQRWLDEIRSARRAGTERRPAAAEYDGPEARRWLRRNRNPTPLAANHFPSAAAARRFVAELYAAGASRVIVPVTCIQDADDDGPYADALVVFLPGDPEARAVLCQRCQQELEEPERIDASDPNPVFLWWD